ncbi:SphA family protein [Pseudomonas yamanorum]|uniref:Transporter n=1 Tax=Pseudomonas yamanorum TaxID=515393 RepID=A0A7Y8K6Z5_9PSED|nr:transporter [Pseudomonas yamanorum]NWE77784.1 transporter [Pseudomonas yamanorum]
MNSSICLAPRFYLASCAVMGALLTHNTYAAEGGGSAYPSGVNTVVSGKLPPPGFTSFVYMSNYQADKTMGNDGKEKSTIHNFDLNVKAVSLRMDYVYSDYSLLGATLASRLVLPFVDGKVSYEIDTPRGRVRRSDSQAGLGDVTVVPLMLGWASPRISQIVGVDVFAPAGSYDKDRLFNPGRNTWAFAPWYGVTFYPIEKLELSSKVLYIINQKNDATDYQSGNEFNIDYNIGYNFTKLFQAGISGYAYKQVTGDEQQGTSVNGNGNKGQVFAIGPSVKYQTPVWGVVVKWQHETLVKNRAEGDRFWLQGTIRF